MASPGARALYLSDDAATGPPEAFIDQHEFCHLHPPPDGTIHLILPEPVRQEAIAQGWAECHLLSRIGAIPRLVLVYGPRDVEELQVILSLVAHSRNFAAGAVAELSARVMA